MEESVASANSEDVPCPTCGPRKTVLASSTWQGIRMTHLFSYNSEAQRRSLLADNNQKDTHAAMSSLFLASICGEEVQERRQSLCLKQSIKEEEGLNMGRIYRLKNTRGIYK